MKNHPVNPAELAPDAIPERDLEEAVGGEELTEEEDDFSDEPISGPVVSGLEETETLPAEEGAPVHEPMPDTSDPLELPEQLLEDDGVNEANIDLQQRKAHDDDDPDIVIEATKLG